MITSKTTLGLKELREFLLRGDKSAAHEASQTVIGVRPARENPKPREPTPWESGLQSRRVKLVDSVSRYREYAGKITLSEPQPFDGINLLDAADAKSASHTRKDA